MRLPPPHISVSYFPSPISQEISPAVDVNGFPGSREVSLLFSGCLGYLWLSCGWDKMPFKRQLKGERAYSSSRFMNTAHHSRDTKVAGT